MKPISQLTADEALEVAVVFTDIDGTITDEAGRIPARVFSALESVRSAGLALIPVTGRPSGWCDLIARTWPVDGVVGENGGLFFRRLGASTKGPGARMVRSWAQDSETRRINRERLSEVCLRVLERFPGAALASDQAYREFDIAVDFCEDVPRLPEEEIDGIVSFLEEAGCHVKVSDIHVNAWFGTFDKASMCQQAGREVLDLDLLGTDKHRAIYFGDSPNDAPLFAAFPLAVGVANVVGLTHRMETLPTFVTKGRGCEGFVEGIEQLLSLR